MTSERARETVRAALERAYADGATGELNRGVRSVAVADRVELHLSTVQRAIYELAADGALVEMVDLFEHGASQAYRPAEAAAGQNKLKEVSG